MNDTAILRKILPVGSDTTGDLYRDLGNGNYRNIRTGVSGEVPDDIAGKIFVINLEMTALCNKFGNVEKLIKGLGLRLQKDE